MMAPMRRRIAIVLLAACGARTPLLAPEDASVPIVEAGHDGPISDACTTHCSDDLHEVLDCHGNVVETCPQDQGCNGTGCSEACLAAQQHESTIGCEYYAINPDSIDNGLGGCFAAFVANTWTTPVAIGVDRDGTVFDPSTFARLPQGSGQSLTYKTLGGDVLQPGEVAILFLAHTEQLGSDGVACPKGIAPAITQFDPAVHGTGRGHAFHITSSAPVVAYQIFPYGGGPSAITAASLLLPTAPYANNFIAVAGYEHSIMSNGNPSLAIVATQDSTSVTINPTSAITAGTGVAGAPAHVPTTYTMSAGELLQITQLDPLTGSVIQSNHPIAVWGGSTCMNIDINDVYCDVGSQQLPPIRTLGSEYVGVRYRKRYDNGPEELVPWRFVGIVDGTTLAFDPPVSSAPATLARGQLVLVWSTGPFVVKSQDDAHPFYLAAHMTSSHNAYAGGDLERGDPEYVNVVPARQFLPSYTFFTDPTYPETNLVVIRKNKDDVKLDCAGTLSGWQPIGASTYEFTRIDLVRHNFQPQNGCDNGRHVMSSASPFALTVWGWGTEETTTFTKNVSYAYPAGASISPINDVVVVP
jgi:hypothetical protein